MPGSDMPRGTVVHIHTHLSAVRDEDVCILFDLFSIVLPHKVIRQELTRLQDVFVADDDVPSVIKRNGLQIIERSLPTMPG